MIEQGLYTDLSNEAYHNDPAISRSGIMKFIDSPYKYWAAYINPERPKREPTQAMTLGSAFHHFVLEHNTFYDFYVVKPEEVFLKDVGKEKYEEFKSLKKELENTNKIVVNNSDFIKLVNMKEALIQHENAWALINEGCFEQSYFWKDIHSGLFVKSRPDVVQENVIIDLKTTSDASTYAFQRQMINSGYHIQAAIARDGIYELTRNEIKTCVNICIEKTYPYAISIKIIGDDALEYGHKQYKQALLDMKSCFESEVWPSYEPEIVELPLWIR